MVSRVGSWLELSFWQVAVRALTAARPLSHGLTQTREALEQNALTGSMPRGWIIAISGWVLGLLGGLWLAGTLF
jgi:hypothetical protein